jgi:hypothetical protein
MIPFHSSLLAMRSTGILSKIKIKYAAQSSKTDEVPGYEVRFEVILSLVGFLTIGVFLSTACLCVELAVRRCY